MTSVFAGTIADLTWPEVESGWSAQRDHAPTGRRDRAARTASALGDGYLWCLPAVYKGTGRAGAIGNRGVDRSSLLLRRQLDHRDVPRVLDHQPRPDVSGACGNDDQLRLLGFHASVRFQPSR